jgi:hypothetical protein
MAIGDKSIKDNLPEAGGPIPIDWEQFERMCSIHCTAEEIGFLLKISPDALNLRVRERYGHTFKETVNKLSAQGKMSLRRTMWKKALEDEYWPAIEKLANAHLGMSNKEPPPEVTKNIIQITPQSVMEALEKESFLDLYMKRKLNGSGTIIPTEATGSTDTPLGREDGANSGDPISIDPLLQSTAPRDESKGTD